MRMTERARITQADMEWVLKSVKRAGIERARVVFDLATPTITIEIGGEVAGVSSAYNEWDDEDI